MNVHQGEQPGFCTVEQLAFDWQLTTLTIYRMVQRGYLPSYRIGNYVRIRRTDAEEFLKNHRRFDFVPGLYWTTIPGETESGSRM